MKWFRLWIDIINDVKMLQLSDYEYRMWTYLLAYASEVNSVSGEFQITFTLLSLHFHQRFNLFSRAIETFQRVGLITVSEAGFITITNWNKRQFRSDNAYERVKKFREVTLKRNVSETPSDTDTDTDTDILSLDNINNNAVKPPRFDFEIQEILKMYHEILPGNPVVHENGTLPKTIRRRLAEKKDRQELIWWQEYFQYVALSDFLLGKKTDFVADLEWLIGPKNMQKVLNGRYHRDQKNGCSGIEEWVRINREKFAREGIENGKEG